MWSLCLAACAPLDGPAREAPPDAALVRACDEGACACGGAARACCEGVPRCEGSLRCIAGTCQRPAARCAARGIFEPGFLAAEFVDAAEAGTPPCTEIPRELFDPRTPGTFLAPAPEVGALECDGLAPGVYTARLRARARALAQYHTPEGCWCTGLGAAALSVTQRGGPTWTVIGTLTPPPGPRDVQCNRGPTLEWSQRMEVGDDGRLALTVDLTSCSNQGEPRCLFLRGASLALDGVSP